MSAGLALQSAVVRAVASVPEISGTFDGAPARASFPYLVVDAGIEADWSHKSGEGREVGVALTLWDDQPARIQRLGSDVEREVAGISQVAGWQLVSLRFLRRRVIRDVSGPWAVTIDFRARLLATT